MAGELLEQLQDASLAWTGEYVVRTAKTGSVLLTNGGVNTPQDDWYLRKVFLEQTDTLLHARIPVGHRGGDQNHIWFVSLEESFLEEFRCDTEPVVITVNLCEGGWFGHLRPVELAGAKTAASSRFYTGNFL